MEQNTQEKEKAEQRIAVLEQRINLLEADILFLKEQGLSQSEQNIVLDKTEPNDGTKKNVLMTLLALMNFILLAVIGWFFISKFSIFEGQATSEEVRKESTEFTLPE